MKRLVLVVAIPVALLLLFVLGVRVFADRAIQAGVETGGEAALGVPTHLAGADLRIVGGRLDLRDLSVENPAGYPPEPALALGRLRLHVPVRNILDDTVEVPLLAIEDVAFRLDRGLDGGTNVQALLDHLRSLGGGAGGTGGTGGPSGPAEGDAGDGAPGDDSQAAPKRFLVRELRLERVSATLNLFPQKRDLGEVKVTLAPIVLTDLDSSGEGMEMGEIADALLDSLLQASIEAGTEQLGDEVAKELAAIGESYRAELEGQLQERVDDLRGDLEKEAGKALGGLGGLLGDKSDKDKGDEKE